MNEIIQNILHFNSTLKPTQTSNVNQSEFLFSKNIEANQLCIDNSFAFLLACLAAQGMKAEKIWIFPYELKKRLGFLNPTLLYNNLNDIHAAIKEKPALHRFPLTMARYVEQCSNIIIKQYSNHAEYLWTQDYDAERIQKRLLELPGFGPKKAAMCVELLHNFLKVSIKNREQSNIATDVHILRVLYRLGLIPKKNPNIARMIIKKLYPQEPGSLDYPLWFIGRNFCKAKHPNCNECPLNTKCKKNV